MNTLNKVKSIKKTKYLTHETKRHVLKRFLLVLAVSIFYFIFVSLEYGLSNGLIVTFLTWSFFVFCTPIADAGFLLDFPVRLIAKIRMIYSEVCVWIISFLLNAYFITFNPDIYERTMLLRLFKHILLHPIFWTIIILSAIGTFMSIYFGDELIDVAMHKERKKYTAHKNKYKLILSLFVIITVIFLYTILLTKLNLKF